MTPDLAESWGQWLKSSWPRPQTPWGRNKQCQVPTYRACQHNEVVSNTGYGGLLHSVQDWSTSSVRVEKKCKGKLSLKLYLPSIPFSSSYWNKRSNKARQQTKRWRTTQKSGSSRSEAPGARKQRWRKRRQEGVGRDRGGRGQAPAAPIRAEADRHLCGEGREVTWAASRAQAKKCTES